MAAVARRAEPQAVLPARWVPRAAVVPQVVLLDRWVAAPVARPAAWARLVVQPAVADLQVAALKAAVARRAAAEHLDRWAVQLAVAKVARVVIPAALAAPAAVVVPKAAARRVVAEVAVAVR